MMGEFKATRGCFFGMISKSSKTYLDRLKQSNYALLKNDTRGMTQLNQDLRMANDGKDGNGFGFV